MPLPIDPNQYGPQSQQPGMTPGPQPVRSPVTDQIEPIRSALQSVEPEMAYFIDSIGQNVQKRSNTDVLMNAALTSGETTQSLRQQVQAAEAAEMARSGAEESIAEGLDDEMFERIMQQMEAETGNMPQVPQRGPYEQPSHLEQGLAAAMSFGTPEHAFDIAAVPWQVSGMRREEKYEGAQDQYKADLQRRDDKLNYLRTRLSEQTRRDLKKMDIAAKQGDARSKAVEKALGMILQGNRPGEAALGFKQLAAIDPRMAAEFKPLVDTIEADAGKRWEAEQGRITAQKEATEALKKQRDFQVRKGEELLQFQVQSAMDKNAIDGLKYQIMNSQVKMLPETEELMRQRVEMGKMKNFYYPQEVALKAQMAEFYAGMAASQFDLSVQRYQTDRDEFSYIQAQQAKEQRRVAVNQLIEAVEADRTYAIKEREAYTDRDSPEWNAWNRYVQNLDTRKESLKAELSTLSGQFGSGPPAPGGQIPGRPGAPEINIPMPQNFDPNRDPLADDQGAMRGSFGTPPRQAPQQAQPPKKTKGKAKARASLGGININLDSDAKGNPKKKPVLPPGWK